MAKIVGAVPPVDEEVLGGGAAARLGFRFAQGFCSAFRFSTQVRDYM
jgi:hypothetical protein